MIYAILRLLYTITALFDLCTGQSRSSLVFSQWLGLNISMNISMENLYVEIGAKRVNIGSTLHGLREAQPNSQVYHFRRITYINLRGCVTAVSHSQTAQAQYESLVINTCGLISQNPQNGHEYKEFVWEFRYR